MKIVHLITKNFTFQKILKESAPLKITNFLLKKVV